MAKAGETVSAVYWQDAAYSYLEKVPAELPPIEITFGVIVARNKEFINIAMNLNQSSKGKKLSIKDGFLIPVKTIVKIEKIGQLKNG